MKIITWNVNGLRAVERKGEIQNLVNCNSPDVLLLQEIKGKKDQFSEYLTQNPLYQQFYHSAGKPGYAGTGIWVSYKLLEDINRPTFHMHVPQAPNDDEGRVSHLSFFYNRKKYDILSIYFPNGGKSDIAWKEKLIFFDKVLLYMNALRQLGHEVIIGGDMNVAHNENDLARPKQNEGKIGFHPDERAWMDRVMNEGWVDVWRVKNPDVDSVYSWWDLKTKARDRNVGWRLDYFFLNKESLQKVKCIEYLQKQLGSDHCPLLMDFDMDKII